MNLSQADKVYLQRALQTEIARVRRSGNAANNPAIREILGNDIQALQALEARIFNEPAKDK